MPSKAPARAASFVQTKLMNTIMLQLLVHNNSEPDDEKIVTISNEVMSSSSDFTQHNFLEICFPQFSEESDDGLLWDGEELLFAVIEVGVSDGEAKIRERCRHWLTRGEGRVSSSFCSLFLIQIKLALSVKIKFEDETLELILVDSYKYSMGPQDTLVTRSTSHGRPVHVENIVSFLLSENPDFRT